MERFSEDIDVLVLPTGRGRGATDKLMKDMGEASAEGIGETATPTAEQKPVGTAPTRWPIRPLANRLL